MKKFTIQVVLLLLIIGVGIFFVGPPGSKLSPDLPFLPQKPTISTLQINGAVLQVEVVDTPAKRSKGLGGRQSLGENEGMLFIFDRADKHPFWMKGLSFALDFIWIKGDSVADVLENVQPPQKGQPDSALPIYSSKVEVDKVLEVNAGTAERLNIKLGDKMELK